MAEQSTNAHLTPEQQALAALWDQHVSAEFLAHNVKETMDTMVEDAWINNVPVMTGGVGGQGVQEFYSTYFIPQLPPDITLTPVSRTVGHDRLVDELVARFTHSIQMDWLLPGISPTGKVIEVALVVIVNFRAGKMVSETLYWDQAGVLVQAGLLDPERLPVVGVEAVRKVLDPTLPANTLIERARQQGEKRR